MQCGQKNCACITFFDTNMKQIPLKEMLFVTDKDGLHMFNIDGPILLEPSILIILIIKHYIYICISAECWWLVFGLKK